MRLAFAIMIAVGANACGASQHATSATWNGRGAHHASRLMPPTPRSPPMPAASVAPAPQGEHDGVAHEVINRSDPKGWIARKENLYCCTPTQMVFPRSFKAMLLSDSRSNRGVVRGDRRITRTSL